jgi:KDO2-lipid IV(A) lauroyltransferase
MRMKKKDKRAAHTAASRRRITDLFSHLFVVLGWLNVLVPNRCKRVTASVICVCCYYLSSRVRNGISTNLSMVFPELSLRKLHRLALRTTVHYGQYFIDYFAVFLSNRTVSREVYFDAYEGTEYFEEIFKQPGGAFIVTPHLGNWELGLLVLANFDREVTIITAPIASHYMYGKLEQFRRRMGFHLITLHDPAQYMFELKNALSENRIVILLADRYEGGSVLDVSFFGCPVRMPTGYIHLARMFDAPILPCFIIRNERGKYTCIAEKPVWVRRQEDREKNVQEALKTIICTFEKYIRAYADQWYQFVPLRAENPERGCRDSCC